MSAPDTREGATFAPHEAADRTGLTLDTLRYYEREGLLGPVGRTVSGRRRYTEGDLAWVGLLTCLRDAGLGIADLRGFAELLRNDTAEATDRVAFLRARRADLLAHAESTRKALAVLDDTIAHYSADER